MNIERIVLPPKNEVREEFLLPFRTRPVHISQGYNGPYSHFAYKRGEGIFALTEDYRYAVDFALPFGTEVFAARKGRVFIVVKESKEWYEGIDIERGLEVRSNFVILQHQGSASLYSHLKGESISVQTGQTTNQGTLLGRTGKSGWIGLVPHLHFAVLNTTVKGIEGALPIRFSDYSGPLEHNQL